MSLNDGFLRLGVLPWIGKTVDHLAACKDCPIPATSRLAHASA